MCEEISHFSQTYLVKSSAMAQSLMIPSLTWIFSISLLLCMATSVIITISRFIDCFLLC